MGITVTACASSAAAAPKELGDVAWLRNFDEAAAEAKRSGKPILILFDEVPGCQTCVHYGESVLTHPLLVEAAETELVPLAIYNNIGGHDREILERFAEPTWNNPVVRIVSAGGEALAPRLAGDYSKGGLARNMIEALARAKRSAPAYLSLLAAEHGPRRTDRAVFSMYCFWSGEVCLGEIDGIVGTRTGFAGGKEVVEVTFDPTRVSREDIVRTATSRGCGKLELASEISGSTKDDKYQLRHTPWRFVPMTDLQASKANALIGRGVDPRELFSPRQLAILAASGTRDLPEAVGAEDLRAAFAEAR